LGRSLLRIRHVFQEGEHPTLSSTAVANLTSLLEAQGMVLQDVLEVSLDGTGGENGTPLSTDQLQAVAFKPLQTRTFEVTVAKSARANKAK
jgi:hypothetical protein